uniref:Luciferin 4-monooxygenase n=1 Tax=Anopheles atroparvus TaxID=41427 RepID=A0A182JKD8_ANOAO
MVFVSDGARVSLLQAIRSARQLTSVICFDVVERSNTFADCLRRSSRRFAAHSFRPDPVDVSSQVAVIVMSSGTTGLPKGVLITQGNVMATMANLRAVIEMGLELRINVDVLPWFHVAGGIAMLNYLSPDVRTIFLPKFEPRTYLRCIATFRPNFLHIVPPIAVFLAKHPLVDEFDLSSLEIIACGAAPLSKEVEELIYARLKVPGLRIRQGYGMSETTQAITYYDGEAIKPGSIGKVRPGQLAKVIDPETSRALGPNQRGELCFKGSLIMKGYIGQQGTGVDPDGWLHTGDIGYYDADGDFYIVDRLKELIKYNGFQVAPAELEALLLSHPAVKDAAVVGIPDERNGELPVAFVVRADGPEVSERELIAFVDGKVSNEKRLRGGVRFVGEIPKTNSGKILRRTLRELAKKQAKL